MTSIKIFFFIMWYIKHFSFLNNTIFSKIILSTFDRIIFRNDYSLYDYRTVMNKNIPLVCRSKLNWFIYRYIYYMVIFSPIIMINLFTLIQLITLSHGLVIENKVILIFIIIIVIIYLLFRLLLKYIIYYHYSIYGPIEKKFMLNIYYVPYKEGEKYSKEYRKSVKFFSEPDDYFEFYNIDRIYINWHEAIINDPELSEEFYDNLYIENDKALADFRGLLFTCREEDVTFFNIYGYHHFRYIAAKKLLLKLELKQYKKENIFLIVLTLLSLCLNVLI